MNLSNNSTPEKSNALGLVTRKDAAQMFDVDVMTIHRWTKRGILTPIKFEGARRIYFRRADLEKLVSSNLKTYAA